MISHALLTLNNRHGRTEYELVIANNRNHIAESRQLTHTEPGSRMNHEDVLRHLIHLWRTNRQEAELEELILEYLRECLTCISSLSG
ncbi:MULTISPECIES: hypothetical protein [unclassified Pseudomonas]|uniref:Uncharacterized protein n=1 Tax=Pseudomonas sp. MYb327 TaxID=2745230 RepID=A0AAU8EAW7_9PSED